MKHLTILPGHDKDQRPEHFEPICSYCVGETRVGTAFQQGVVGKIALEEAAG